MNNPRLATRYAKSIIDLSVEKNQLNEVYADMKLILDICKSNRDFVALLRSPIINAGTKRKIIESIIADKVGPITNGFVQLLVLKSRESNLPEIAGAFVDEYNHINNIHKVKLTTAVPISDSLKDAILDKVKNASVADTFELETIVDEALIGGFVLETEGKLVDASVLRDLKDVKKQFQNNDYLHKIR